MPKIVCFCIKEIMQTMYKFLGKPFLPCIFVANSIETTDMDLSTPLTILFYVVLLTAAYITGKWLVRKDRNY
jgi:hypothetical protein